MGRSTNGLLAIVLGRLCMDVRACKQAHRDLSRQIFRRPCDHSLSRNGGMHIGTSRGFSGERLGLAIEEILPRHLSMHEKNDLQTQGIAKEMSLSGRASCCFECALVEG